MISFGFEGNDYLVSSVEIRNASARSIRPDRFLQPLHPMYVLVNERHVLWKETIGFQQEAFVYRTKATPRQAQEIFVDVMRRVNKLVREPEFYNTVTNCTTNVRNHVNHLIPDGVPYDYRVLLPGYSDELAYDLGLIEAKGSFEETKAAAEVNYNAYLYRDARTSSRESRKAVGWDQVVGWGKRACECRPTMIGWQKLVGRRLQARLPHPTAVLLESGRKNWQRCGFLVTMRVYCRPKVVGITRKRENQEQRRNHYATSSIS